MHWRGHWWGTELVSDNKKDELFLKKLHLKLTKKAAMSYEDGDLESHEAPDQNDGPDGGFTLTFNR